MEFLKSMPLNNKQGLLLGQDKLHIQNELHVNFITNKYILFLGIYILSVLRIQFMNVHEFSPPKK